jgi:RNA polymerase sigma factor (sigma-70 family)
VTFTVDASTSADKKLTLQQDIIAAYDAYANGTGSDAHLFALLLAHARRKSGSKLNTADYYDTGHDDDAAQDAVLAVWEHRDEFTGDGAGFFAWFNRIAFTKRMDGLRDIIRQRKRHAPVVLDPEDDHEDAPAVSIEISADVEDAAQKRQKTSDKMPGISVESASGEDMVLVRLMEMRLTYGQIATKLRITETGVKKRVERLRERAQPIHQCPCRECLERIWAERKPARDEHQAYRRAYGDAAARRLARERSLSTPELYFSDLSPCGEASAFICMKTEQEIIWEERRALYPHHRKEAYVLSTRNAIDAGTIDRVADYGTASCGSVGVSDWPACA